MWPARKERASTSVNVRPIVSRIGSAAAGVRAYSLSKTIGKSITGAVQSAGLARSGSIGVVLY